MKKIFVVLLGITPFLCLHQANAQRTPKAPTYRQPPALSSTSAVKATTITCTVSADEKRILDKDDKSWTVANPKILKGHAGDYVSITAEVDASKNRVTVKSVKVFEARAADIPDTLGDPTRP